MGALRSLLACASLTCVLAVVAFSQVVPLRVEDVVAMRSFTDFTPIRFSPDGKHLVYAAGDRRRWGTNAIDQYARTGVPIFALGADLFMLQIATGEAVNLTGSIGNNWAPSWSPDGRFLAFLSDRDGSSQAKLWIWEAATGKMRKVSDLLAAQ
jgi:WD40 repeat protein